MNKSKKTILACVVMCFVAAIIGVCIVYFNNRKSNDDNKSLREWISRIDENDTSVKVYCGDKELKSEDKEEFINILKKLSDKELKWSDTSDETTPNYIFVITDGETRYEIIDQVSYEGKAYISKEGDKGGWYIKNVKIREFMDDIYDKYSKNKK